MRCRRFRAADRVVSAVMWRRHTDLVICPRLPPIVDDAPVPLLVGPFASTYADRQDGCARVRPSSVATSCSR